MNPNGRIPVVVNRDAGDLAIWETGSILRYLSEVYDKNYNLHFDNIEEETEMVRPYRFLEIPLCINDS